MNHGNTTLVFSLSLFLLLPTGCPNPDPASAAIAEHSGFPPGLYYQWGRLNDRQVEIAQSFRAAADASCSRVELLLMEMSGSPSGEYIVSIETDAAGFPSGTPASVNASASRSYVSLSPSAWNSWPFDQPVPLDAGQTYWIVCRTTETANNAHARLTADGAPGDGYPDGRSRQLLDGTTWADDPDNDLAFRVLR